MREISLNRSPRGDHDRSPIERDEWMMKLSNGKIMFRHRTKLSVLDIEEGQLFQFDIKEMAKAYSWDSIMSVVELPNQILLGTLGVTKSENGYVTKPSQRFFLDLNKSENNITFKERPSPQDKTWEYLPVLTLPNNVVVAHICSSGKIREDKAAICFFQVLETGNLFMIAEAPFIISKHRRVVRVHQIIQLKDGNILVFVSSAGMDEDGSIYTSGIDYHGKIIDINTKSVKSEFVVEDLEEALEMRPGVLALLKRGNVLVFWSLKQNKMMQKLSLAPHSYNVSYKNICALDVRTLCFYSKDTVYLYDCPAKSKSGVFPEQEGSRIERLSTKEHCCAIF